MQTKEASQEEINEAERKIDAALEALPLPFTSRVVAHWNLLTAVERVLHSAWHSSHLVQSQRESLVGTANRMQYSLKHALALSSRRLSAEEALSRPPFTFLSEHHNEAHRLLLSCEHYQMAVAAFSSFRAGRTTARISKDSLTRIHFKLKPGADNHAALDILVSLGRTRPDALSNTLSIIYGRKRISSELQESISTSNCTVTAGSPHRLDKEEAFRELHQVIHGNSGPALIPSHWSMGLGSGLEISRMLKSLETICAYHLLAVQWNERLLEAHQELATLVPVFFRDELAKLVQALSSCTEKQAITFVDVLVWGSGGVSNPDSALQPLIPVGDLQVMIAPLLVLTSNLERNFLALTARTHKGEFDANRKLFELGMTQEIVGFIRRTGWHHKVNFFIPGGKDAGEVDLALADSKSKTLVIDELRWTLPPGETRELIMRTQEAPRKVAQAIKKSEAAKKNLRELLQFMGHQVDTSEIARWSVFPLVIFEGFAPETTTHVPVVSRPIFLGGTMYGNLKRSCKYYASREWMPRRNVHFKNIHMNTCMGGVEFNWGGVVPLPKIWENIGIVPIE